MFFSAVDGLHALSILKKEHIDMVITDIMMPRMDGIELIRHIKENVNTCDIPLIILSAKSSVEDRIQCLQLGIDDYIPKPFSSDYLKSRIESLIRQRKSASVGFFVKVWCSTEERTFRSRRLSCVVNCSFG